MPSKIDFVVCCSRWVGHSGREGSIAQFLRGWAFFLANAAYFNPEVMMRLCYIVRGTKVMTRALDLARLLSTATLWVIALLFPSVAAAGFMNPGVIDTIPVPVRAFGVAVNPLTDRLYVSAGDVFGLVSVVDTQTNTDLTEIHVGDGPQGIAVNPVTNRVYAVNVRDQTVSVIDANTNAVIATISGLAFRPRSLGINRLSNTIYVANEGNGSGTTLSVINGYTNAIIQDIHVGTGPNGVAVNSHTNRIYTANGTSNTVSVVDGSTNTVIATIPVGFRPLDVAVNVLANKIYVSNSADDTMSVIDGETNVVIDTIPVGKTPRGISIDEISNQVYLANYGENSLYVIDGITNSLLFNIPVGLQPHFTAFDAENNRLYVANDAGATVTVIGNLGSVPEPTSLVLFGLGTFIILSLNFIGRRRTC
ncbi:YncE family protein [Tundrisphaera lichenicola]|uniref:YncE family protein n=1 Tax=Tundrisphaera lichenicola TaxID=2029860 RepID=UPI003EC11039